MQGRINPQEIRVFCISYRKKRAWASLQKVTAREERLNFSGLATKKKYNGSSLGLYCPLRVSWSHQNQFLMHPMCTNMPFWSLTQGIPFQMFQNTFCIGESTSISPQFLVSRIKTLFFLRFFILTIQNPRRQYTQIFLK